MTLPDLTLFDLDGVLANGDHRVHHALAEEWVEYFAKMGSDTVYPEGRQAIDEAVVRGDEIGYLTGRREDTRPMTQLWLIRHDFPTAPLLMRPVGVKVPLANLKVEYIKNLSASGHYGHVRLYDDDPEVIRLVREEIGPDAAVHCTWHVKEKALIREATA